MLIAFIAFLVCFELPRSASLFEVNEAIQLRVDGRNAPGRLSLLSTSNAKVSCAQKFKPTSNQNAQLYLHAFGAIDVDIVSCSNGIVDLRLRPTLAQHRQLVVGLFGGSSGSVSDRASMGGVIVGTILRGFGGN
jgi:cellulose synthase (UDP-forming)